MALKPMASSNTRITFSFTNGDTIIDDGIVSVSGGGVTRDESKQYNYRGEVYSAGEGSTEIEPLSVVMYWNAFNKMRYRLVEIATGVGELTDKLVAYKFNMLEEINPGNVDPTNDFTYYRCGYSDCYVIDFTRPEKAKDTEGYTTTVRISIGSITESNTP